MRNWDPDRLNNLSKVMQLGTAISHLEKTVGINEKYLKTLLEKCQRPPSLLSHVMLDKHKMFIFYRGGSDRE
jgi:hypothetical protein